jgi:hypothetical protein
MGTWGVAKAKAHFSAVLDKAETEGPQLVERRKKRFVLLMEEELAKRSGAASSIGSGPGSGKDLWNALRCPPEDGVDVKFPRISWEPRKVKF